LTGALTLVATTGAWAAPGPGESDATVVEALRTGEPVRAVDLPGAGPGDSDLAAPIIVGDDTVGVLTVRGVARVGAAALRDLTVVAEWLATAVARARARRSLERSDRSSGLFINV
jgi:GAF domain-containing protein